jgi:hypothetical protein
MIDEYGRRKSTGINLGNHCQLALLSVSGQWLYDVGSCDRDYASGVKMKFSF